MIWVRGRILPEAELSISVADRTFEHGLGLFETLRTWRGRATLLPRHLARLSRSAQALGLPLDPTALPTEISVAELRRATPQEGDSLLRITMTGGLSARRGAVVWMRATPLPQPLEPSGAAVGGFWRVDHDDPIARHKCLNYWRRRLAYDHARSLGLDESLSMTADGAVWEGSRTNLFWIMGRSLETPTRDGPLVPGVMRELVVEHARRLGLDVIERSWPCSRLSEADEVFLTNAVRGIVPVRRLLIFDESAQAPGWSRQLAREWPAPGTWTNRLRADLLGWLSNGGAMP
jgi:branched-chain amino acid aminotransferase